MAWYYHVQGQMALTGVEHTYVIYTSKEILIVLVELDPAF